MVKHNAFCLFIVGLLLTSCSDVKHHSDFINLKLSNNYNSDFVRCYEKHQPHSMDLDEPYFSDCLALEVEPKTLIAIKNEVKETLKENNWSLHNTIENTEIYLSIRSYDKCAFYIHVTEESYLYTQDYFGEASKERLYSGTTPTLIISRFTKPICT